MKVAIARLWAKYVFNGDKTLDEVPDKLKDKVVLILAEIGWS